MKYDFNPYGYSPYNNSENQIKITINHMTWLRISIDSSRGTGRMQITIVIEKYGSGSHLFAVIAAPRCCSQYGNDKLLTGTLALLPALNLHVFS